MSPDPPPPEIVAPPETPLPEAPQVEAPQPESYPFWGYLDLLGFILIGFLGMVAESLLLRLFFTQAQANKGYVLLPAQFLLYGFLLASLAMIFRRYYGRPFWKSLAWVPSPASAARVAMSGMAVAFAVIVASVLIRTPDIDSPMKTLLKDPASVMLIAILGTTLAPICEEILFRGFLQPLLVRSFGAAAGILGAAVPFGLLHLQEYGYSWRHAVLITMAGAAFGWMRERTGSTKAAALMHASYNFIFFLLLAAQQAALHGRWAGYGK